MTRFASTLSLTVALLGATINLAAATPQGYDQETQMRRAKCNNDCLFQAWPEGYCVNEPGCNCNHQEKREKWLCCIATKCEQIVLIDAMENSMNDCKIRNKPYEFDPEAVCGITLTSSVPPASKTPAPSPSSKETSVEASITPSSTTGVIPSTVNAGGAAQTSDPAGSGASLQGAAGLSGLAGLLGLWGVLL
ncbi:hypothetical protein V8F20_012404 [Naviculisporaceae sp. PSN 640]